MSEEAKQSLPERMREAFKTSAASEAIQEIGTRPEVSALLEDLCRLRIRRFSGSPSIFDKQLDWEFRQKTRELAKLLRDLLQASATRGEVGSQSHVNKTTKQGRILLREMMRHAMFIVTKSADVAVKAMKDLERKQRECEQKQDDKRKRQEFIKQQLTNIWWRLY
jgi:hypothetical protein